MKTKRTAEIPAAEVQLVPLIDCVFLLLIFFMCCASMTTVDSPTEVRLPFASNGAEQKDPSHRGTVNIVLPGSRAPSKEISTEEKPFLVSGVLVNDEGLQRAMTEAFKRDPVLKLYLRADRNVKFAMIRRAMGACAAAGVQDIVFATYLQDISIKSGE